MPKILSKKEIDENKPQFALLPHEEYELVIVNVEEKEQEKYDHNGMEIIQNITLEVRGLKGTDEEPKDDEGESAVSRKIWFTARPDSTGFMQDGTPAKTRCLVYYAMGETDLNGEVEFEDWQDLVGKVIYAEIIQKTNTKGKQVNSISRFVLPPRK